MSSIHGKVLGLAMVMAALGTGCAVDAADAELDQADLDEMEAVDSTSDALEEATDEERGGYQAQAPSKDMFGPSKGLPSKGLPTKGAPGKGMIGAQGPVGQLGQGPVGQLGQGPVGQLGQGPVGQLGQGPVGELGQAPYGTQGQSARNFGCGLGGGFFPGAFGGGFFPGAFGFGGFPININNNNNINIAAILDQLFNRHHVCPPVSHAGSGLLGCGGAC